MLCIGHFRPESHIPKVTNWTRNSENDTAADHRSRGQPVSQCPFSTHGGGITEATASLELLFKPFRHFRNQLLVPSIPAPMPLAPGFHQVRSFEDPHVVANRGLREFHPLFNIGSTEPSLFPDRASAFFFQREQNAAARRIGDGVQKAIQIGNGVSHENSW